MKRSAIVACAAASILALSACSGGGDDSSGDSGELTPITVGTIPIVDAAPLYLGVEQGYFEDAGLDVTIDTGAGGAALVPGVQSGDYDFAFSNVISIMIANDKGLNFQTVANGVSTTGNTDDDFAGVVVRGDSDIQTPADLEGKTVATNTLGNIGDTAIRMVVDADGGDPSKINFIELAFPDAVAALQNDQADAVYLVEPFVTAALDNGDRVVSYFYAEINPELDISTYFTTQDLIDNDPELVKSFQEAMDKSLEYAQENPDAVREIAATYTEISPEVLARVVLPNWSVDVNKEGMEQLGEAAVKYGAISKAPDLNTLLPYSG